MITAAEVLGAKFQATKFREGYDQVEVDDFLDRVVATLRACEGGAPASAPVTVAELDGSTFTRTTFREGYDTDAVDAMLDRVREALLTTPAAPAARVAAPTAGEGSIPGLVQQPKGWRRIFGG